MTSKMRVEKTIAFLHDPPDKVLKIIKHEDRAKDLLKNISLNWNKIEADIISSSLQRLVFQAKGKIPSVDFYGKSSGNYIHVGYPVFKHPVTACKKRYECLSRFCDHIRGVYSYSKLDEFVEDVLDVEKNVLKSFWENNPKGDYFRIWNYYVQCLKNEIANMLRKKWLEVIEVVFRDNTNKIVDILAEELMNLPAETRCPDHSIWDHLDATSAIHGALIKGKPALLMFKISPVQDFIKNARKEKDLWAGSHLLSFLTFKAIEVVVDEFGPDAIIFPHLRGQPFFDKEYGKYFGGFIGQGQKENLKIANIPNKFLAIIGCADDYEEALETIKLKIENKIHEILNNILNDALEILEIKESFEDTIRNYFKVTVEIVPANINKLCNILEELPESVKDKYKKWINLMEHSAYDFGKPFDLYSLMFELIDGLVAISSRKFEKREGESKYKCTMCGELEIVGTEKTWKRIKNKFREFRETGIFKENEELCPICLIKRYYPLWIKSKLDIDAGFESVSEVALRKNDWLSKVENFENSEHYRELINALKGNEKLKKLVKNRDGFDELIDSELLYIENWNLKYLKDNFYVEVSEAELEEPKKIVEKIYDQHEKPEKYYAILIMDGDNMGKMLVGDEMKPVKDYLHPAVLEYLLQDAKEKVEKTKRLITPATHAAISRALAYFSVNKVSEIVKNRRGELIYAGGDDVLALLPIDSALRCAYDIQGEFGKDWDGWELLPSKTMSAGILIVHYKHPLYDALDKARMLEKKAKNFGRDAVAVGHLTRRGSYSEAVFNWDIVPELDYLVWLIRNSKENEKPNVSRRIIYHVVEEINKVPNDEGAITSFLKYGLLRHYDGDSKEEIVGNLLERIMNIARKLRVEVRLVGVDTREYGLCDEDKKVLEEKLNASIQKLVKNCELSLGKLYDVARIDGVEDCKFYEKLYGLILKKQVRSLFILLKILVDCDAELGGGKCENAD